MVDINYHTIEGNEYFVPKEVSYRQYYAINELLKSVNLNPMQLASVQNDAEGEAEKVKIDGTLVYAALMSEGKLPEFFAILLVPKDSIKWDEKFREANKDDMFDIGDTTMLAVLQDFLNGRADLIENIMDFLVPLIEKKTKRITDSAKKMGSK